MSNDFQDWKPVILKKSHTQLKKEGKLKTETVKKYDGGSNKQKLSVNQKKLEEADVQPIEKVSHSLKMQIMKARNEKKWTQKELAAKVGVPAKTIQTYENGTAIPDNAILNKLRRVLDVKLKK